jgi:aquaporin Z
MKRYIVEFIGTMLLAIAISFTGNPLAIGLMLMALIYVGGHVSGGYFNPVLTIAGWMRDRLSTKDFCIYLAMQTVGACVAVIFFNVITQNVFMPDASPDLPLWIAISLEGLLSMLFCLVFLVTTQLSYFKVVPIQGMVIGLTLVSMGFIGGIFNPAVGLGSLLVCMAKGELAVPLITFLLIYLAGPLMGGLCAVYAYEYLYE